MREPLIPRDDWLADSLNALFLRRVWRTPVVASTSDDLRAESFGARPAEYSSSGICEECGNYSTRQYCEICSDPKRDRAHIMVVSNAAAIQDAETRGYSDLYHVHSPATNPGRQTPHQASVSRLLDRLRRYRAFGVSLNLGEGEEDQAEQRRLQEILARTDYSVAVPPFPWTTPPGQPSAAFVAYAAQIDAEAMDEPRQRPEDWVEDGPEDPRYRS